MTSLMSITLSKSIYPEDIEALRFIAECGGRMIEGLNNDVLKMQRRES